MGHRNQRLNYLRMTFTQSPIISCFHVIILITVLYFNIFFTLALGLLALRFIDKFQNKFIKNIGKIGEDVQLLLDLDKFLFLE